VVYEEVSKCVDGMVVDAVFQGQFARGGAVGVVIALHSFYQAAASRRDYECASAVAAAYRTADQFDTF